MTILDAPSIHHQAQDAAHGFTEPASVHWRNVRLKDDEIALADHIVTVSELARRTYLDAGVAAERLHAVPLGVDFELFSAASNSPGPQEKPLTFVFAGATIYRKGIDLLVEALTSSGTFGDGARLVVVGPPAEAECELRRVPGANLERIGRVTQDELARVFSRCDCLVLPSRDDSFGMVVPEALAAGCPVIVSEMVGAKDLVRPGENGWVVPAGDTAVLGDRLRWCMTHQVEVRALRSDCRESARRVTWSVYHERVASLFKQVLTRNET